MRTEDYSMKNEMENGQDLRRMGKSQMYRYILAAGSGSRMQSAVAKQVFT